MNSAISVKLRVINHLNLAEHLDTIFLSCEKEGPRTILIR